MALGTRLGRQALRRLLLLLLLTGLLCSLVSIWIYRTVNAQAAGKQLASAHEHYANTISSLEQQWGREAFNFKIRLESQRFLENTSQQNEKLTANLIAQGGSLEFPSLRIENSKGELIASFEHVGHKIPKARFLPGQESTWAYDPVHAQLFMVFRQLIWLGNENGNLLLFKPMDHALLSQYSYPFTRLSLWWKNKPVASSEGRDGLAATAAAIEKLGKNLLSAQLPWSATAPDNAPFLFIELTSPPLLTVSELAGPLGLSLAIFALIMWLVIGNWGRQTLRRIRFLERAQNRFLVQHQVDGAVKQDLAAGHANRHDEITALATALERLMEERTPREQPQSTEEKQ